MEHENTTPLPKRVNAPDTHIVLGIESSCDDTAASVIARRADGTVDILSNEVWAQHSDHQPYGGVVPEIAARQHADRIDVVIAKAMERAGIEYAALDGVAATAGPGLIGGVMVGLSAAKGICLTHHLPLIPVNHLEGHALSVRLTDAAAFPFLLLLISGGHTQLIAVRGLGDYTRLGTTIDDAAGEAFDKTAKLLGLGQPGGPKIEAAAAQGDAARFPFPRPLAKRDGCDFSLSGLKTALRLKAEAIARPTHQDAADLAAGFQQAIAEHLVDRTRRAMAIMQSQSLAGRLVVAGGVAANKALRSALDALCREQHWQLIIPPAHYCTDNGAMIALAGAERMAAGLVPSLIETLAYSPRARWPLAPPPDGLAFGGGKKGPKA